MEPSPFSDPSADSSIGLTTGDGAVAAEAPRAATSHHSVVNPSSGDLAKLALGALGVVYGDIGTSPLYAIRECVTPPHGVGVSPENILGVLSLVFWAIAFVISIKYLLFVMRADNEG